MHRYAIPEADEEMIAARDDKIATAVKLAKKSKKKTLSPPKRNMIAVSDSEMEDEGEDAPNEIQAPHPIVLEKKAPKPKGKKVAKANSSPKTPKPKAKKVAKDPPTTLVVNLTAPDAASVASSSSAVPSPSYIISDELGDAPTVNPESKVELGPKSFQQSASPRVVPDDPVTVFFF